MKRAILLLFLLCLPFLFCACGPKALCLPTDISEATVDLCVALDGEKPKAADFLSAEALTWCEQNDVSVDFVMPPDFKTVGEYEVALRLHDVKGRACELTARMTVVQDTISPTLLGVKEISSLVGEGLVLRAGVSAVDDCFGAVEWTVDASAVDTSREGIYSATYRATDASGNVSERTVYVHVWAEKVTEQMLWDKLAPVMGGLFDESATLEQKCRAIHAYVQGAIAYFPISDKTDPVRAAYHALFVKGRGDCYSYFSAAMLMLQCCGIEYLEIERLHEPGKETHFWLMVNLAPEGEEARWYHFDPTLVEGGGAAGRGCLFTDTQLDAYNAVDPGFYDYERSDYPPTATEIITE
jgi:hypothetical protein